MSPLLFSKPLFHLQKGINKIKRLKSYNFKRPHLNKFITITLHHNSSSMRPLSQREYSNSAQKPDFQTKLKPRQGTHARLAELNLSVDVHSMAQTQRSKHNHEVCQVHDDIFAKTASKLSNTNFSHLNQTDEVSKDCLCGRHLGKFHVIKPDLTKNTIYQRSFYPQQAIPNIVNHDKEYEKLKGPHLDMNSTQREGFTGRKGDKIERPHPEDLLHSNGPCPQLSSYSSQFPGYRGDNQYVKPTDSHTRGYFPLRSKSTYTKEFINKAPEKDDYTYFPDQIKTGSNWFGKTTYGEFFSNPNPEYFAKKVKVIEKKEENPDYNRQYETIYKNDFVNKPNPLCPSKIYLETKAQGSFRETKGNFAENSDFKALSPDFHAIAMSKHSYV